MPSSDVLQDLIVLDKTILSSFFFGIAKRSVPEEVLNGAVGSWFREAPLIGAGGLNGVGAREGGAGWFLATGCLDLKISSIFTTLCL